MSIVAAIRREKNDADLTGYRRIVHIRVTADAIPGSITSTPISPERLRNLAPYHVALPQTGGEPIAITHPEAQETLLEILMHPIDHVALLKEADEVRMYSSNAMADNVCGIPIVH